ncbi:15013_t:CDS:1, partial [Gigaspora rosea]
PSPINSSHVSISMPSSLQPSINTHVTAKNATAQNDAIAKIQEAMQQIVEYEKSCLLISDQDFKNSILLKIKEKKLIKENEKKLGKLKNRAEAQARFRAKKKKQINEDGIVEQYNKPGRPPAAILYPDLWNKIHDCVEFGAAHAKRKKPLLRFILLSIYVKHWRRDIIYTFLVNVYLPIWNLGTNFLLFGVRVQRVACIASWIFAIASFCAVAFFA